MAAEQQVSLLPGHLKAAVCRLRQHQGGRLSRNLYKFWYTNGVAGPEVIQVHPVSEVRARLSGILARFRHEGAAAEPVADPATGVLHNKLGLSAAEEPNW